MSQHALQEKNNDVVYNGEVKSEYTPKTRQKGDYLNVYKMKQNKVLALNVNTKYYP